MKSNETKNADYLKFFKPCLIVTLILIVISAFIVGFLGFNTNVDFYGGTQLVVEFTNSNINIDNDEDFSTADSGVREILSRHGININSFQVQGEYNSKSFVITFDNVSDDILNTIRLEINSKFNTSNHYNDLGNKQDIIDSNFDLTRDTSVIDSFIASDIFISIISTLLFALTIICIYACFRVKVAGGLTILFGAIFDIVLMLCFIALARIEVNRYIFVVLGLITALSVYASSNMMFDIKEKAKDPSLSTKSNYEIANLSIDSSWKKSLGIYLGIFLILVIWGIFTTTNVLHTLLAILAGVVVVFGTHLFVTPAFWVAINRQKETFTKHGIIRTDKSVDAVVVNKENDNNQNDQDKDAEVIEINED